MNRLLVSALSLACLLGLVSSCSSAGATDAGEDATTGAGPGGPSTGGSKSTGGTSGTAGGAGGSSAAGTSSTGGSGATGGSTGGSSSNQGGTSTAGGSTGATGGTSSAAGGATGGTGATGGASAGTTSTGGTSTATGGTTATGGASAGVGGAATGGTGIGGISGMADLIIVPADATLSPPSGVAPQLAYKAILQQMNLPDQDVTTSTTWSIGPSNFGSFNGSVFMAPVGTTGLATVEADAGGLSATTTITITPPQVVIGTGADNSSPGKFGGSTDPNAAIQLVYPANGVLVPPNMNSLEFHFIPAAGQTLFQLDLESPNVSLTAYFGCTSVGSGCAFAPDATFWKVLANTARGGDPVSYTLKGVNGANPGSVGTSATQTIQFSTQDITGGLYYWEAVGATTVIERYDFGYPDNPPETYLTTKQTGGLECVGCHVLSRDGTKILAGHDIPEPAAYTELDVATTSVIFKGSGGGNFFSFSPDASQYLSSTGKDISLHDATTGMAIGGSFGPATMPDWSPDGANIVYAKPTAASDCVGAICAPGVVSAAIEIAPFANDVLGQAKELVPFNGQNNYYPAFSPDGQFVIYNVSPSNEDSFANAAIQMDMSGGTTSMPDGELWMVSINGGAPIELANATTGSEAWPKLHPNVNTYEGGNIVWATFSSWRPYGLRTTQWEHAHLWMVAIDLQKLAAGQDGSFPAFWIPFQNITTENRIGQWVTQVQRQPCTMGGTSCPSQQVCKLGRCVPMKM